jgi:molybdopterin-guanine dinucleotide biosynthesis protein A
VDPARLAICYTLAVVAAFILAGGKSSRMGADKAFLRFQGATLLERATSIVGQASDKVFVSGPREKFGPEAIEDILPGRGPLGGIYAALASSSADLNLILAVDLPFVEADFLKYLVRRAEAEIRRQTESGGVMAVVPRARGGWQPLCALYRRQLVDVAEKALRQKRYKIDLLFAQVPVLAIDEAEILQAGFSLKMFDNLNTREEFELAQRRAP